MGLDIVRSLHGAVLVAAGSLACCTIACRVNFAVAFVRGHWPTKVSASVPLMERSPFHFGHAFGHDVCGAVGAEKPYLTRERRF